MWKLDMPNDKSDDNSNNSNETNILEISKVERVSRQTDTPLDADQTSLSKVLPFAPKKKPLPAFDVEWFYEDEEFFSEWMDEFDM